ncbi:MAG: DUF1178 family protein [Sphingobium sp.]
MIIFDLKCARGGHVFEAWFKSSDDYDGQQARGLLSCPLCGDSEISKAVMAPAVPAKTNQQSDAQTGARLAVSSGINAEQARKMMEAIAVAQADALKDSEWVGRKFADTARAMHYGEKDQKGIHGEVAPEEARSLIEEGIEVAPLLLRVIPPEAQN